jgi:large subunit ribosomal protein L23
VKDHHDLIIRPVVSEKSYTQMEDGVYTFVVAPKASKLEIRQAVEAIFGVTVTKVNTVNRKGKTVRNRRTRQTSKRSDVKRAFVTLAEGDSIELFNS